MSESIRQRNLFSAEDYKKIFKAYSFIDYTAYDFDTLKQALLEYIRTYYWEDYNDYVESSEFIAIVELLAYLGTSLAFRSDMNSRENFIDTAERRESIIRLAQMVNYVPRRNVAASGLFKIVALQTNQPLKDANGNDINDTTVFWNDPNNPDWFDQFIQITNAAFSPSNPFGRPSKSGIIGNIPTDLYQLESVRRLNVTYQTTIGVNGQQYAVDICNPDFNNNETIFERDPDPDDAFNFVYRNDSLGAASANTGFFLYFRQGNIINIDANFDFPIPNRVYPIDIRDINQTDVYVQETDEDGAVISKWKRVPALAGENIIYNSISLGERNIFDVLSGANDTVSIRFPDGNFGNVPTGLFRFWVRTSANQALVIKPEQVQNLQIAIPYIGADEQTYTLRVVFSLQQTVSNSSPSETNDQIKLRAPEVFSTQSRMVNGSDYNVLPLVYGNQIAKLKAVNRTYSGHSRYLDINDPTGFHRNLSVIGDDGAIFRDNQNVLSQVIRTRSNAGGIESIVVNTIQSVLNDQKVSNFFYDEYLTQFENTIRIDLPFGNSRSLLMLDDGLRWKTSPAKNKNDTGYFSYSTDIGGTPVALYNTVGSGTGTSIYVNSLGFIKEGAILELEMEDNASKKQVVAVNSVSQSGIPMVVNTSSPFSNIGPVELSTEVYNNYIVRKVLPPFRNELTADEIRLVIDSVSSGVPFWMYYDVILDKWGVSGVLSNTSPIDLKFKYPRGKVINNVRQIYSEWSTDPASCLIYVDVYTEGDNVIFDITGRGRSFVFHSSKAVRFYWEPNQTVVDSSTGQALKDTIEILPYVNTNNTIDNNLGTSTSNASSYITKPSVFNISGSFLQTDGYLDTSKVEISAVDSNNDGIPDYPSAFSDLVNSSNRIVFEYYRDDFTGYQSTRLWKAKWSTNLITTPDKNSTSLYVYFPVDSRDKSKLYSAPYIATHKLSGDDILSPSLYAQVNASFRYAYLDESDLIFINSLVQLEFSDKSPAISIANQVSAFFNGPTDNDLIDYPWLSITRQVESKKDILEKFFFNKSFLIDNISYPGNSTFCVLEYNDTTNTAKYPTGKVVVSTVDRYHFDKNGKSYTQNTSILPTDRYSLNFKWDHYTSIDQRIDPSPSNIVDMIVITEGYNREMILWKNSRGSLVTKPIPPTSEELRLQFQDLNQYKMISDSVIWNSGKFKILFGPQAEPELQATFKVVKAPSANISDNEVKIKVVNAIDKYFDIRNWDFGEKFYFTELSAFIHQELSRIISSVVIVPNNSKSQFGNLFEIVATPNELFMSTATVANIEVISNLTEQMLRL